MSERFFVSEPITTDRARLDGPEAHHLLHVMRADVGQAITLFDDSGAEFAAVVQRLYRSEVDVRIVERRAIDRELPFTLTVGVALPKGDRQKWLVEKLTELGVAVLVPLSTERCVAQPTCGTIARLTRTVIEASKQCGRNRLMQITAPRNWPDWISQNHVAGVPPSTLRRLLAHPGGSSLAQLDLSSPHPTQIAVGPEGGLTDAEVACAVRAGWQAVDLGPRILRVETAAIALAAVVAQCHPRG
jgi:16S rRNA (uracil1498-N3)-methyltransferase